MNFEFNRDLQEFEQTTCVDINRMIYKGESVLMCKIKESDNNVGVYRIINLPNIGQYTLKIICETNNNRTYVNMTDTDDQSLIDKIVYLKKDVKTNLSIKFYASTSQIKIHILIGGDSIGIRNDTFILYNVRIIPLQIDELNINNSTLKITRKYETVKELENESKEPFRNNNTPMEIGEYAILKDETIKDVDNLYILGQQGLKYVSKIGTGIPSFFGDGLPIIPGKILPVYDNDILAKKDLEKNPKEFYNPKTIKDQEYEYRSEIQNNIYLYLDSDGYVRWLKY